MATTKVALVLGSGARVGAAVSAKLAAIGYQVATVSRKGTGSKTTEGYLSLKADFANPSSVAALFDKVKTQLGASPAVVVYNCAALTKPSDSNSMLSISTEDFMNDLRINVVSPYTAAQQAVEGWKSLPEEELKTFIYTGNILNTIALPQPIFLDLGVGKSASAHWISAADQFYAGQGYRFFYADERTASGDGMYADLHGDAHADFYEQLVKHEGRVPWHATFVRGRGYVDFAVEQ